MGGSYSENNNEIDVNNSDFKTFDHTSSGTEKLAATTGGSGLVPMSNRQWVRVVNKGAGILGVGPTGGPYETLFPEQGITYNHGPANAVFFIAISGTPTAHVVESA